MNLSLPPSLAPARIEKLIKDSLASRKLKVDPDQLAGELKKLDTLNKAVDTALFDPATLSFPTAAEAQARLTLVESKGLKSATAAAEQARKVATLGQKSYAELKANKEVDKRAAGAINDVAIDAQSYAGSLLGAAQSAVAALRTELARLQALEKKNAKAGAKGEDEDDAAQEKDVKVVAGRVATAMKLARDAGPTKPMKFIIGLQKKKLFVYVAKAVSGSTAARIKVWMEAEPGSVSFFRGDVLFENKAHTFVGVNIPTGGFAVRIQRALADLTGKRFKIRVRRPTGETDESGGEDDDDADGALDAAAGAGGEQAAAAARVRDRHQKLAGPIDAVIRANGPLSGLARQLVRQFEQSVAGKKYDQAAKTLDELEAKVLRAAEEAGAARERAEKEIARRVEDQKARLQKALAGGGDGAKKVKAQLDKFRAETQKATKSKLHDAFDRARRELDQLEKTVDWALSERSAADKAQDVARAAKKVADDAAAKARAELERRRAALKKKFGDALAAGGKAADEAKKRIDEAEKALAEGARSGAKEGFAKAHRALDAAEQAADWALSERSARDKADDLARAAQKEADAVAKQVEKAKIEAAKQLQKITDPVRRAEVFAAMKAVEAERQAVGKLKDAQEQAKAYAAVLKKFEETGKSAAKAAAEKVAKAVGEAAESLGQAAKKILG